MFQRCRDRHHQHATRHQRRQVGAIVFHGVQDDPAGYMLGAKRGQPQFPQSALDDQQWHAGRARDLANAAEHRTVVVATYKPHDDANR
jgi:hypothetical protein